MKRQLEGELHLEHLCSSCQREVTSLSCLPCSPERLFLVLLILSIINQSQVFKKGISCHSGINVQIFVRKNYSGISKFKTIDHSKHKLDFYNWSYFGYCQSKCTFGDQSWLLKIGKEEQHQETSERRTCPKLHPRGAASRDLVKDRWVNMRMCFSARFLLSSPATPLMYSNNLF